MSKRAVILAGGRGTRLRPYTVVLPKPLMPVGDFPILEIIIRQLVEAGFSHITLAVSHQADIIKAFFQNGERWGVYIDYTFEIQPLGTMGPLKLITNLPDYFLVMNGDILSDLDYALFYREHIERNDIFTISAMTRQHQVDYGVLETDTNGRLTKFHEKPSNTYLVSMGIYMLSLPVLRYIPEKAFGFDELMLALLSADKPAYVRLFKGYWLDIGRPDDYVLAIDEFETMKKRFLRE